MKVILQKDVPGIGRKYDLKEVSDGHARNFLFPRGLAQEATSSRLNQLKILKQSLEEKHQVQQELLLKNLESLKGVIVTIKGKSNEQGHLFKGIRKEDILAALFTQTNLELSLEHIELEHPLKEVGEHTIPVSVSGKHSSFTVAVETE